MAPRRTAVMIKNQVKESTSHDPSGSEEEQSSARVNHRTLKREEPMSGDELDLFSTAVGVAGANAVQDASMVSEKTTMVTPARKRAKVELDTPALSTTMPSPVETRATSTSPETPASSIGSPLMSSATRAKRAARATRVNASYANDSDLEALSDASDDVYKEEDEESVLSESPESPIATRLAQEDDEDADLPVSVAPRRRRAAQRRPRSANASLSQYEKTARALAVHHPELEHVWDDLSERKVVVPTKAAQPDILTLQLLPFQLEGLNWLRVQENSDFRGGILADEMGMGKTIQTVALLATDTTRVAGEAGTLVVAPAVAIIQWKNEIEKYTNSALSVHIYHGSSRSTNLATMKQYDVVLTTYNLLESCYRKQQSGFRRKNGVVKEKSFLHGIDWHRVVLDEAHCIKDRACNTARAIFALQTERRLCLSGTPLQNRVGELFSLLRFLKADPFSYYYCKKCPCKSLSWKFKDGRTCDDCGHSPMTHTNWFNHELLKPIQRFGATGEGRVAFSKIHQLLGKLMLRRTKVERADDMGLPPRVEIIRRDMFNPEELDLYESLYTGAKRQFSGYVAQGVLLNSYANVFQLITRLRQMADHPDLVLRRIDMQAENNLVCRLCDDVAEDCIAAKCKHHFCRVCVTEFIDTCLAVPECPVCNTALSIDLTAPGLEPPDEERMKKSNILNRIDMTKWKSSTKIEALVEELYKLRSTHSSTKSIVFSQFTSFLELIAFRLRKAGFNTCKLDGSMTPEQRHNTIVKFSTDIQFPVFLVSLKAGGVALNLTEASTVFLVDSWWSPSAEWQAADRIHRLGQYRPVAIKRIVIANSIEERIVELQAKKVNMIKSTLDHDATSLDRLNQEDMEFLFT